MLSVPRLGTGSRMDWHPSLTKLAPTLLPIGQEWGRLRRKPESGSDREAGSSSNQSWRNARGSTSSRRSWLGILIRRDLLARYEPLCVRWPVGPNLDTECWLRSLSVDYRASSWRYRFNHSYEYVWIPETGTCNPEFHVPGQTGTGTPDR